MRSPRVADFQATPRWLGLWPLRAAGPRSEFAQPAAVLGCEDCLAETEEAEEIYENFDVGEALRGPLEMAFPVAERLRAERRSTSTSYMKSR